jgi:hypothetical protein
MHKLKFLPRYIRELYGWLLDAEPLLALLASFVVVSTVWVSVAGCIERQVRFTGIALQLFGVILVVIGLRDTRRTFDELPTTLQAIRNFWSQRPRLGPRNVTIHAESASLVMIGGTATARVTAGPNTPIERRVELLEQDMGRALGEIDSLGEKLEKKTRDLGNAVETEARERKTADTAVTTKLRQAVAEGIPLAAVGAVLVFIGILCGASPEIARLFGEAACS